MDEYAHVVNVDVAVLRDGEYLFVERAASEEHAAGLLSFPGGTLEDPPADEDAVAATARREVREETGVEVTVTEYVTSTTFTADTGNEVLNLVVRAGYAGGEAHVREPEEIAAVHWLTPAEVRAHEGVPRFVERYVDAVETSRESD